MTERIAVILIAKAITLAMVTPGSIPVFGSISVGDSTTTAQTTSSDVIRKIKMPRKKFIILSKKWCDESDKCPWKECNKYRDKIPFDNGLSSICLFSISRGENIEISCDDNRNDSNNWYCKEQELWERFKNLKECSFPTILDRIWIDWIHLCQLNLKIGGSDISSCKYRLKEKSKKCQQDETCDCIHKFHIHSSRILWKIQKKERICKKMIPLYNTPTFVVIF